MQQQNQPASVLPPGGYSRIARLERTLDMSRDSIYRLIRAGDLRTTKLGDIRLVSNDSVIELMARKAGA